MEDAVVGSAWGLPTAPRRHIQGLARESAATAVSSRTATVLLADERHFLRTTRVLACQGTAKQIGFCLRPSVGTCTGERACTCADIHVLSSARSVAVLPVFADDAFVGNRLFAVLIFGEQQATHAVQVAVEQSGLLFSSLGTSLRCLVYSPDTYQTGNQSCTTQSGTQTDTCSGHAVATLVAVTVSTTITVRAVVPTSAVFNQGEVARCQITIVSFHSEMN